MPKLIFDDPNKENSTPRGVKTHENCNETHKRPQFSHRPLAEVPPARTNALKRRLCFADAAPQSKHPAAAPAATELAAVAALRPPRRRQQQQQQQQSAGSEMSNQIAAKALELRAFSGSSNSGRRVDAQKVLSRHEWTKWNRCCLVSGTRVLLNPSLVPLDQAVLVRYTKNTYVAYAPNQAEAWRGN